MSYITEGELRWYAQRGSLAKSYRLKETKALASFSVFLSHSHKDRALIEGFLALIAENMQVSFYVDWQDKDMPRVTDKETASRLKTKIRENDYFMVLATSNAMASRWVPWEIGLADTIKGDSNVVIIPVADKEGNFKGNEYLQLYKRLAKGEGGVYGIFPPLESHGTILSYFFI